MLIHTISADASRAISGFRFASGSVLMLALAASAIPAAADHSWLTLELNPAATDGVAGADHLLTGIVVHPPGTVVDVQIEERDAEDGAGDWSYLTTVDLDEHSDQFRVMVNPAPGSHIYRAKAIIRPNPKDLEIDATGSVIDDKTGSVIYSDSVNYHPTLDYSNVVQLMNFDQGVKTRWIVGLGDSYMSGEGATYAQFNSTNDGLVNGFWSADWWIQAYGDSLEETYPDDYAYPLDMPLYGRLCHRSRSAPMHWREYGDPYWRGMNFACSGATSQTHSGKPGVDFAEIDFSDQIEIKSQCRQL